MTREINKVRFGPQIYTELIHNCIYFDELNTSQLITECLCSVVSITKVYNLIVAHK